MTVNTLPILSFKDLATEEGKKKLVSEFLNAAQTIGFFQLIDHGVPQEILDGALEASKAFFSLPIEEKVALLRDPQTSRGYERIGGQSLYGQADARGEVAKAFEFKGLPDQKEGYSVGKVYESGEKRINAGRFLHGDNKYPPEELCPGLQEKTNAYYKAIRKVIEAFMVVPSVALGKDEGYIASLSQDPVAVIRMLRYPPQEHPGDVKIGAGAHTDFGLFTFLATFGVPGLQVWYNDQWNDVSPVPGSLIVNIGDGMSYLSGGKFISSLHRVLNISSTERYSIPFFYEGDNDALLEPPGGTPIKMEAFLRSKYDNTYSNKNEVKV